MEPCPLGILFMEVFQIIRLLTGRDLLQPCLEQLLVAVVIGEAGAHPRVRSVEGGQLPLEAGEEHLPKLPVHAAQCELRFLPPRKDLLKVSPLNSLPLEPEPLLIQNVLRAVRLAQLSCPVRGIRRRSRLKIYARCKDQFDIFCAKNNILVLFLIKIMFL